MPRPVTKMNGSSGCGNLALPVINRLLSIVSITSALNCHAPVLVRGSILGRGHELTSENPPDEDRAGGLRVQDMKA
jgi:hypothetical protein